MAAFDMGGSPGKVDERREANEAFEDLSWKRARASENIVLGEVARVFSGVSERVLVEGGDRALAVSDDRNAVGGGSKGCSDGGSANFSEVRACAGDARGDEQCTSVSFAPRG
jgi:hypothetical protein